MVGDSVTLDGRIDNDSSAWRGILSSKYDLPDGPYLWKIWVDQKMAPGLTCRKWRQADLYVLGERQLTIFPPTKHAFVKIGPAGWVWVDAASQCEWWFTDGSSWLGPNDPRLAESLPALPSPETP